MIRAKFELSEQATWNRMDSYYEQRDDGQFRVSASKAADGWKFSAWRKVNGKWQFLDITDTAAEARALCEEFDEE